MRVSGVTLLFGKIKTKHMNWYLFFYLLSIVNNICTFCVAGGIIATIWSFIGLIVDLTADCDNSNPRAILRAKEKGRNVVKIALPIAAVLWILAIFTPSRKDVLLIISGGAVGEFISNDSSSLKIPSDMIKYLHLSIQKEIEELKADSTVNK